MLVRRQYFLAESGAVVECGWAEAICELLHTHAPRQQILGRISLGGSAPNTSITRRLNHSVCVASSFKVELRPQNTGESHRSGICIGS
ncbi:Uncharacterised protein [Mycobacteroides abscessus subsp. abscessus]|nr:Uncharacterised protein [Mycobacteroides abscessus subsp. abscessus]